MENENTTQQQGDLVLALLGLDNSNFTQQKSGSFEVERLSKLTGSPFIVSFNGLSTERVFELQDNCMDKETGGVILGKFYESALEACGEAIVNPNFNDVRLKNKFKLNEKCLKIDVIKKVLKPKEINAIYSEILDASGFDKIKIEKELKKG